MLKQAEQLLGVLALGGDLLTGAVLTDDRKRRDALRASLQPRYSLLMDSLQNLPNLTPEGRKPVLEYLQSMRDETVDLLGGKRPFHWPLEFPEVFLSSSTHDASGGFSAIVGNPPFLGGQKLTGAFGTPFRDYLVDYLANGQRGSADLCAYFLLRCGSLLSPLGGMGMLATNTIAQGDTREVGLDRLVADGFTIQRAIQSQPWPGAAALEVAHLWLRRGPWQGEHVLEHHSVSGITPYLTIPGRAVGTPYRLAANAGKSFIGSYVLGKGFVLEQKEALAMIERDPRNRDVLFPYLNGEDLNSRPDQSPSRWVINFHDWPLERAMEYPEPFSHIERHVKPERHRRHEDGSFVLRKPLPERWWHYAEKRPALYRTIADLDRVIGIARVSKYLVPSWMPARIVYSEQVVIVAANDPNIAGLLQSTIHELWVRSTASSLETRLRYTPSDCFETFPLPEGGSRVSEVYEALCECRDIVLREAEDGLTWFHNMVHDPFELAAPVHEFWGLMVALDCAVAEWYGWNDLDLEHGFHETKQGVRFTISERVRREVLDRLLELNHQRYAEEVAQGLHDKSAKKAKRTGARQQSLL